jgi:hypothetical protein
MPPSSIVISSPLIPNCPADDTCANTKAIRALLALDGTWSTVVKIATVPAPLAGAPGRRTGIKSRFDFFSRVRWAKRAIGLGLSTRQ